MARVRERSMPEIRAMLQRQLLESTLKVFEAWHEPGPDLRAAIRALREILGTKKEG